MSLRFLLVLLLIAVTTGSLQAQRLSDGEVAFDRKAAATNSLRKQLIRTHEIKADASNQNHLEAIEIAAKEIVYPLYWKTERRPAFGEINAYVERFEATLGGLSTPRARENTAETQQIFCRKAIDAVVDVLKNDSSKPIATINAARILSYIPFRRILQAPQPIKEWVDEVAPRLTGGNGEHLATVCLQFLQDPKTNDGTKYYLYKTLATLLALPLPEPVLKNETIEKIFVNAQEFVEKPNPFPKATSRQEVEGYKMLRHQAVVVLAQAKTPIVGKTRVALTLCRVAADDESIVPAPRIEERVEAAIGLCQVGLQAAKTPDYNVDYSMVAVARAVAALGRASNENVDSNPPQRNGPWVIYAARLIEAAEGLKFVNKYPYVQKVVDQCLKDVLNSVERRGSSNQAGLIDWIGLNPPAMTTSLFKNDPKSVLKPRLELKN